MNNSIRPEISKNKDTLILYGDSWCDFPFYNDISKNLDKKYHIKNLAKHGNFLKTMAYDQYEMPRLLNTIWQTKVKEKKNIKAIIISGGGNDFVEDKEGREGFSAILNHKNSGLPNLNQDIGDYFFNRTIKEAYIKIFESIIDKLKSINAENVPIIIHGYGNALPDGRSYKLPLLPFVFSGPWLEPTFTIKGYHDLDEKKMIIETLMEQFNDLLKTLSQKYSNNVRYVDVRGLLSNNINDYQNYWSDEFHPTKSGFKLVTDEIIRSIEIKN